MTDTPHLHQKVKYNGHEGYVSMIYDGYSKCICTFAEPASWPAVFTLRANGHYYRLGEKTGKSPILILK